MAKQDAVWTNIDPSTLPERQQQLFVESKEAYRQAKAAKERFETSVNEAAPEGKRFVFGYNFGKLSIALVDDERKPAKAKTQTASLADFLNAQGLSGYRN